MIYRLVHATSFIRIVADDDVTQREIAICRGGPGARYVDPDDPDRNRPVQARPAHRGGSGNWPQAVKDAELIVASLNYAHGHATLSDALKCEQCMPTEKLLAELQARPDTEETP